jgi:hypothetical protein
VSGNSPVDPYEVPEFTGSWCELDQRVKALSGASTKIVTAATDVHTTFGGLRAFYRAPEAEQLFAVTEPVRTTAQLIGSDLSVIAGALRTYAQDGQPLVQRLNELRAEAQAFRTGPAADDEWREDADLIDENLDRRNKIAEVWAAFQDVEKACHGKIVSLVGGTPLKTDDGSGKEGMYGYDAEVLKQAKSLPWGDAVEESTPGWQVWEHGADFVTGFAVDGVWATVVGIGTLAGFNGWDAAGDAWSGLATLGEGLGHTIIFGVDSPFWTLPEDQLPARMRESRVAVKETGKALLAWDDWEAHPGRAAGAVTFNVLTTVFTGGAGGAAATTAKAGAVAKALSVAGKVSRVVDPMTYVFKGAGAGLSKLGDAMASLRNLGKIQIPPLPEGAFVLPEGAVQLPDGTVDLPAGTALPDGATRLPDGNVRLPENTPVLPPNTVRLPVEGPPRFMDPDGNIYRPDGSVQHDAPEVPTGTVPAAGADSPSVRAPDEQPALVGVGARGGDTTPTGANGHSDTPSAASSDAGPVGAVDQDGTRNGYGGNHVPSNLGDEGWLNGTGPDVKSLGRKPDFDDMGTRRDYEAWVSTESTIPAPPKQPGELTLVTGDQVYFRDGRTAIGYDRSTLINFDYVRPIDGYHDVVVHGQNQGMFVPGRVNEAGVGFSAGDTHPTHIADAIRANPSYNGGPVRLLSCHTGTVAEGALEIPAAQAVANELGVPVMAPTNKVGVSSRLGPGQKPTIFDGGYWRTFLPVMNG